MNGNLHGIFTAGRFDCTMVSNTTLPSESASARPDVPTGLALGFIHAGAVPAFLPMFFSLRALVAMSVLYFLTGAVGICLGYHRLLTHRSMRVPRAIEYVIATLGALALQGGPVTWVATHRAHHRYSDTERDPHDSNRGFLWCHMVWLFGRNSARLSAADCRRYARDLAVDPYYRLLEYGGIWMTLVLAGILFAAGGWPCVIWGIFVRLVITYHATWLVNSAAHESGYRSYNAGDRSTNNWWVALLAWGEGWHNNHHAFPASARHGLRWYEIDFTWLIIRILAALGVATDIKLPSTAMLRRGPVTRSQSLASL